MAGRWGIEEYNTDIFLELMENDMSIILSTVTQHEEEPWATVYSYNNGNETIKTISQFYSGQQILFFDEKTGLPKEGAYIEKGVYLCHYKNGYRHRDDGPAIEISNEIIVKLKHLYAGFQNNLSDNYIFKNEYLHDESNLNDFAHSIFPFLHYYKYEEYWNNGKLHRENNLPAVTIMISYNAGDGTYEYWENNKKLNWENFNCKITNQKEVIKEWENTFTENDKWKTIPFNPVSQRYFSYEDTLLLQYNSANYKLKDPRWVTRKQAELMDWKIKDSSLRLLCKTYCHSKYTDHIIKPIYGMDKTMKITLFNVEVFDQQNIPELKQPDSLKQRDFISQSDIENIPLYNPIINLNYPDRIAWKIINKKYNFYDPRWITDDQINSSQGKLKIINGAENSGILIPALPNYILKVYNAQVIEGLPPLNKTVFPEYGLFNPGVMYNLWKIKSEKYKSFVKQLCNMNK